MTVSEAMTIIAERVFVTDGSYTVVPGPQSVIYIYKAALSVVETIVSTTEIDVSAADTVVSALPTSFFAAELIISAAEKTAGAVPAAVSLNHQPTRRYV